MSRYRQLADETEKLIAAGTLCAGDYLPEPAVSQPGNGSTAAGSLPAGTHPVTFHVFSRQENTMRPRENATYRMP